MKGAPIPLRLLDEYRRICGVIVVAKAQLHRPKPAKHISEIVNKIIKFYFKMLLEENRGKLLPLLIQYCFQVISKKKEHVVTSISLHTAVNLTLLKVVKKHTI